VEILGKKLVIWQDNTQNWRVMSDICPHKLASLSLGKIKEDGTLMCRHHGWCFNSEGKCTHIPMLSGSDAEKTACESKRSQVNTYPTQIQQQLLWVWLDNSVEGVTLSQQKMPAILAECENSGSDWYMSDVPLNYIVSLETSFDPSHAQFLHEGLGFKSENTIPIQYFEVEGEISPETGFTLKHSGYNNTNKDMEATRTFTPPCSNSTIYRYPNGKKAVFQLYFVPTRPGYCRYIVKFIVEGMTNTRQKSFFDILPEKLRQGLQHSFSYKLADQDVTIMSSQAEMESKYDMMNPLHHRDTNPGTTL
jgi:phenylpropionate dioxygenase-like ring-hydroxylating dioxygenase large terminal subunit